MKRITPLVILLVVAIVARQAAAIFEPRTWPAVALTTVSMLAGLAFLVVLGALAVRLGRHAWQWFVEWLVELFDSEPTPAPAPAEAQPITQAAKNLNKVLADLEQDTSRATVLIADANMYTDTLVKLVKGIALKAAQMKAEIGPLSEALEAIGSGDPLAIARSAGKVKDGHLRELMLCNVTTPDYWAGVARTIAAQLGTLEQWAAGYDRFVGNILTDISSAKAQLAGMTAAKELATVARPMLQIQDNLTEAKAALQPQRRLQLGQAVGTLPSINAGLLGGE